MNGRVQNQRGISLVVVLIALSFLAMLAVSLTSVLKTESKLAGHNLRESQALNVAEAGVAEAISRIQSGDVPDNNNPRMVTQIFLAIPGSVPELGPDSTALATSQAAGKWLQYSTTARHPSALTVQYKTDAARTVIYRFDAAKNPSVQTTSGMPIFQITATGRVGEDTRTVISEVVGKALTPALLAVVSTRSTDVSLWCGASSHGPFVYNGMNHSADTPTGAGATGPDPENYVGSGDVPAFWCPTTINYGGNKATVCCPEIGPVLQNQPAASFYAGPWAALSMTQAEFYAMVGAPKTAVPATLTGITYLDNNSVAQDRSGSWTIDGKSGDGLLYVDGKLTIKGNFNWRGLIYVEGELDIQGNIWVLGGVVGAFPNQFEVKHVQATFLYSKDAIAQIATTNGKLYNLSWRETR